MSQTKILSILVGLAVVAGAAYFAFMPKTVDHRTTDTPAQMDQGMNDTKTADASLPSGKKIPFADFVKKGGSYKCTVHQNIEGMETVGTNYISDGLVRGEYVTKMQGMTMDSMLIVRDGYTYSWSSMMPNMGYKTKVAESATPDTSASMSGSYSWDATKIGDYDCEPWTLDPAQFELPKGVTFTEIAPKKP